MKVRFFAAAALAAVLAVAATTAASARPSHTGRAAASKITVWLQVDAQSGWPEPRGRGQPGVRGQAPRHDVDVQYQTWGDHLSKFDATLAGGNTPDVIEMGNTEMTKYMAAGAFANLSSQKGSFPNSKNWLKGLAASGIYNGKTFGVPYYAGSRVVTYRTDLYRKAHAKIPTSLAQFTATAKKLDEAEQQEGLLAGLHRGHRLVLRDELRLRLRRPDRRAQERQVGRPARVQEGDGRPGRLQAVLQRRLARQQDRHREPAAAVRRLLAGQGGLDRRPGLVQLLRRQEVHEGDEAVRRCRATSRARACRASSAAPTSRFRLGSNDKSLAADWIRIFTSTAGEKGLQAKGNIPNTTNLLGHSINERAAKRSWFVPTAKNWVNVENGNVLRTMLARILTGKASIAQATAFADSNIELTLNQ